MAFSPPTMPWSRFKGRRITVQHQWSGPGQKTSLELMALLAFALLLMLGVMALSRIQPAPDAPAQPAPVLAAPQTIGPVHFSKLQGSTSITESIDRPLPVHTNHTALESALQQLLAGPTAAKKEAGLYSEIPAGTRLLGVTVSEKAVTINLSHEFTQGGGSTSMIQRVEELRDTVQAVEGPKRLKLAIEGKPLTVLGGEGLEITE